MFKTFVKTESGRIASSPGKSLKSFLHSTIAPINALSPSTIGNNTGFAILMRLIIVFIKISVLSERIVVPLAGAATRTNLPTEIDFFEIFSLMALMVLRSSV